MLVVMHVFHHHLQQRRCRRVNFNFICRSGQPLNLDAERKERTLEQMAAEAAELRPLFEQQQ